MNCGLCNGKGIVHVVGDCFIDRTWPCPKCRVRKYCVDMPFTDYDLMEWKDNAIQFEDMMRARLKERIAKEVVEAITDIEHTINGTYHILQGKLSVVIS